MDLNYTLTRRGLDVDKDMRRLEELTVLSVKRQNVKLTKEEENKQERKNKKLIQTNI